MKIIFRRKGFDSAAGGRPSVARAQEFVADIGTPTALCKWLERMLGEIRKS